VKCSKCRIREPKLGCKCCSVCIESTRRCRIIRRARRDGASGAEMAEILANRVEYTPIDEWLSSPRIQIMRAVRRFGWATSEQLLVALDVNEDGYNAFQQNLRNLFKQGKLERRDAGGGISRYEYRLTSIAHIAPPNDAAVEAA
jgi:hypothetical protein